MSIYIYNINWITIRIKSFYGTSKNAVKTQICIAITCDVYGHWIAGKGREGLEDALRGFEQKPHIFAYNKKRFQ